MSVITERIEASDMAKEASRIEGVLYDLEQVYLEWRAAMDEVNTLQGLRPEVKTAYRDVMAYLRDSAAWEEWRAKLREAKCRVNRAEEKVESIRMNDAHLIPEGVYLKSGTLALKRVGLSIRCCPWEKVEDVSYKDTIL